MRVSRTGSRRRDTLHGGGYGYTGALPGKLALVLLVMLAGLAIGYFLPRAGSTVVLAGAFGLVAFLLATIRPHVGAYLLVASVFLVDLAPSFSPTASGDVSVADAIAVAVAFGSFVAVTTSHTKLFLPAGLVLFALYLMGGLLSALVAGHLGLAAPRAARLAIYGLAAISVCHLFSRGVPWKQIAAIAITGGVLTSLFITYNTVVVLRYTKDISVLNTNAYAFFLDLAVPVAVAYLVTSGRRVFPAWAWLALPVMLIGWAATLSRGSYVGLVCGLMLVLALSGPRVAVKLLPIGAMLVVAALLFVPDEAIARLGDPNTFANIRSYQWANTWQIFTENPLLGIGLNALIEVPTRGSLGINISTDPHNFVLRVAAESGIVGLLCVFGIIAAGGSRMFLNFRRLRSDDEPAALLNLGMLGGITAYLVHSLFDVFWVHSSGMLFWIFVGLAYATTAAANYHKSAAATQDAANPLAPLLSSR